MTTSSPPPSTFFAASITRGLGSGAAQSHQGSPFLQQQQQQQSPPQQRQQQQAGPTSVPTFYSDPSTPFDEWSAQTAFWTPFPAQVMPIAQQEWGSGDVSALGGQHSGNWTLFGGGRGGGVGSLQQQGTMRHQSDPGHADHSMSGLQDWNWD